MDAPRDATPRGGECMHAPIIPGFLVMHELELELGDESFITHPTSNALSTHPRATTQNEQA